MWFKAGILHRNVSYDSIMYQIRDNAYHFILTDFDMAVRIETEGNGVRTDGYVAPTKHQIGTLTFAAWELAINLSNAQSAKTYGGTADCPPTPHYLRHEYETLFHISHWAAITSTRPDDPDA